MEGLIYRGKFAFQKSIGLALQLEVNLLFLLYFTLYLMAIFQVQASGGGYIWKGDLLEGFWVTRLGAYTWRGLFSEFYGIPLILFQRKSAALVVP